jgi:uncharacterized protein (TIRG00374 family)
MSGAELVLKRRRSRLRDWRVWFGVAVTGVSLWLALRGVPFGEVALAIRKAHWGRLVLISVPSYVLVQYLRALRWRYLTDPIRPLPTGALFRAVCVGFMANNVFPLRMGEVVRAWYLGRETGVPVAAVFGTVILERVIDTLMVVVLAMGVVLAGRAGDDGGFLEVYALLLLPIAVLPFAALGALRYAPTPFLRAVRFLLRPFPRRFADGVESQLRRFQEGLGALRGGVHLFWIFLHSLSIWLVASTLPVIAGFQALGIRFPSTAEEVAAGWAMLAAIGVAVAVPSTPGFVGPFHLAARVALQRFGVAPETAVACGTVIHAVMWVTITGLGLLVLRLRRTSLEEVDQVAGGDGNSLDR